MTANTKTLTAQDNNRNKPRVLDKDQHACFGPLLREFSGKMLKDVDRSKYWVLDAHAFAGGSRQEKNENSKESDKIWDYAYSPSPDEEGGDFKGHLKTGNIVAWLGDKNGQAQVHSRFDSSESQNFLQYMLYKVCTPNLLNAPIDVAPQADNGLDILPLLFASFLKRAYTQQGLYKEYVSLAANDARVCGPVDVGRHIKENTPFQGKISYRLRRHEYDNRISRLILHTAAYLNNEPRWHKYMEWAKAEDGPLREALNRLHQNCGAVQQCRPLAALKASEKAIRSPYYSEYEVLRVLCRRILQQDVLSLQGRESSFGILFDVAWLWEEYLAGLMPKDNIRHAYARESGGKTVFQSGGRAIYSDFYRESDDKQPGLVLDAKYKHLEGNEIGRDDLYQMVTYLHVLQAQKGILVYPHSDKQGESGGYNKKGILNGLGGELGLYGLTIPSASPALDYRDFCREMKNSEKEFQGWLQKSLGE
ncbi:hypothetical protein P0082_01905 [Candidatus Haliotispira prima]|uniref:McrBC 5-methylcytosine restriction system component n=1 Tax=Candidatus Haliotispira prima TaxID=3034016 RepID=A0ABY8MLF8_9SPIO|nr:hypothetical protein P0082_01905 [Candidatus Haliotispira prima]